MYMCQVVRVYHDDESDLKASEIYTAKFEINRGTPGYKFMNQFMEYIILIHMKPENI